MPHHHGKSGKSAGVTQGQHHGNVAHQTGGRLHTANTKTTTTNVSTGNGTKKTITPRDGSKTALSALSFIKTGNPTGLLWQGAKKIGNIFQKKAKEPTLTEKTANMEDAYNKKTYKDFSPAEEGANVNLARGVNTQSLVTAPTADKAAGFGHQWNFQAYGNQTQTATNVYDYTQAPYAKKGKLIRKYATGQEIKNFSKGKRFGPPPLKGPDPQGIQVVLENSDYFKKLIG